MNTIFGILPESLFFTLFLTFSKHLKNKKIRLFILLCINNFISKLLISKNIFFYISYICIAFLIIKFLYRKKADIIDIFVISIASSIVIVSNLITYGLYYIGYNLFGMNYYIFYLLDKFLLFVPLFFCKKRIRKKYLEYRLYWNRATNHTKRKSISVRLTSLISLCILICIINIGLLYIYY